MSRIRKKFVKTSPQSEEQNMSSFFPKRKQEVSQRIIIVPFCNSYAFLLVAAILFSGKTRHDPPQNVTSSHRIKRDHNTNF